MQCRTYLLTRHLMKLNAAKKCKLFHPPVCFLIHFFCTVKLPSGPFWWTGFGSVSFLCSRGWYDERPGLENVLTVGRIPGGRVLDGNCVYPVLLLFRNGGLAIPVYSATHLYGADICSDWYPHKFGSTNFDMDNPSRNLVWAYPLLLGEAYQFILISKCRSKKCYIRRPEFCPIFDNLITP